MPEPTAEIAVRESPEATYLTGVLFHGAREEFDFDRRYRYNEPNLNITDGSATLGFGLYLVKDLVAAEKYSLIRGAFGGNPVVYAAEISDAKLLDFVGINGNVSVPAEIIDKWRKYFLGRKESIIPEEKPPEQDVIMENSKNIRIRKKDPNRRRRNTIGEIEIYSKFLEEIRNRNDVDLRQMLGSVVPADMVENETGYVGSGENGPPWVGMFGDFVSDVLGYDGIIYREGSEKDRDISVPSGETVIIYNLECVKFGEKPLSDVQASEVKDDGR